MHGFCSSLAFALTRRLERSVTAAAYGFTFLIAVWVHRSGTATRKAAVTADELLFPHLARIKARLLRWLPSPGKGRVNRSV